MNVPGAGKQQSKAPMSQLVNMERSFYICRTRSHEARATSARHARGGNEKISACIGHFEVAHETGSVSFRIALWGCFGDAIQTWRLLRM